MSIQLTLEPATASVKIVLASPGGTLTKLVRTDRNGAAAFQAPSLTGGLRDLTCALDGTIEYRAVWSGGAQESATVTMALDDTRARLGSLRFYRVIDSPVVTAPMTSPSYVPTSTMTEHETVLDLSDTHDQLVNVAPILNSPVPYMYRPDKQTRTGTLTIWCDEYTDALQVRDRVDESPAQYLRTHDHAGMDRGILVSRTALDPDGAAWRLALEYTELPATPIIPLASEAPVQTLAALKSVGTLGDLATSRATLANVRGMQ